MGIVIGLDIGGSTTKIVGLTGRELISKTLVRASDPVASAFGGLGKFLTENELALEEIDRIMVTGVGASYIHSSLLGVTTTKAEEFRSIGLGGLYLSQLKEAVVVSMGTGTAIVHAAGDQVDHVIGSGVGGGTLLGLSDRLLHVRDFTMFSDMADRGNLANIDLTIGDITRDTIPGLSADTTASNFGKISDNASAEDIALGIVNLVFQSIGTASVLVARQRQVSDIVFTGNLTLLKAGKNVLKAFSKLYDMTILLPTCAEFATAIGAALCQP